MLGKRWMGAGLAVLTAGAAVALPAAPALADSTASLSLTGFGAILADPAHGHVFVSGGPNASSVLVRNADGSAATTISGLAGASGLALSADGSTLYVALAAGDGIASVDTSTLAVTGTVSTGATTCPTYLSRDGGTLYFGYGCTSSAGAVGSLDLSGGTVTPALATGFSGAPRVAAGGGHLIVGEVGVEPATLHLYDTSGGGATAVTSNRDLCDNLEDLTMTPDTTRVLIACGSPYHHIALDAATLGSAAIYTSGTYPAAITTNAGGSVVVASTTINMNKIFVSAADGTAIRSYSFPSEDWLVDGGLAVGGSTVYALTKTWTNAGIYTYALRVLPDATKLAASLTLSGTTSVARGGSVTLSGTLSPGAGYALTVTRRDLSGTHALPAVTTMSGGAFTISDTATVGGSTIYTVGFAGDSTYAASSASSAVTVARSATSFTLTTDKSAYAYGGKVTATAKLGTVHDGRSVCFYATPYGGTRALIRCTTATSSGVATAPYTATRRTVLTAAYAGDQWYNPVSESRTVTAAARIQSALTGYYKKSGSTYYYRTKANPNLVAQVLPNRAGSCVRFTAQVYVKGAWHTVATASCLRLDSDSRTAARLYGSRPVSVPFRMQAVFTGDTSNTAAAGSWYNFRFTK